MSLKADTTTIKLNNGVEIPAVGLGTWRATDENSAYTAVKTALQNGYRHIDTAAAYGNEEEVGKAIKDSGVPREEIFVTTKLWNTRHKEVETALDESLNKLGLEYIDLYLMHWPVPTNAATGEFFIEGWSYVDTYKSLEKVYKSTKKIKTIGVSNFTIPKLQALLDDKEITTVPAVNQIELHPLLPQPKLLDFMKQHGIYAEAYSPLGSADSPLFKNEDVVSIAKKLDVEPAQVLVSWAIQRGTIVLPKSVTPSRVISNLQTLTLSDEDFATLNGLADKYGKVRTCDVPEWKAFVDDVC